MEIGDQLESAQMQKETPARLRFGLEALIRARTRRIEVTGLEQLTEIPSDRGIIFAPSHLTDLDVPIAAHILANKYDIGIADVQTHHDFTTDPLGYLSMRFTGQENWYPLRYAKRNSSLIAGFNFQDFQSLADAMKTKSKAIVFAAHNPSDNHILPLRGGIGAIMLSQMTDSVVVPIAVNAKVGDKFIGRSGASSMWKMATQRPDVQVSIGKPLSFLPIMGFGQWLEMHQGKDILGTPAERGLSLQVRNAMRNQSRTMMEAIAKLLPSNKRGVWAVKP